MGEMYEDEGNPTTAKAFYERCLSIHEKQLQYDGSNTSDEDIVLSEILERLADVYLDLQDASAAKRVLERLLVIVMEDYGAEHFFVATTLSRLGNVFLLLGDFARAKLILEKALPMLKAQKGSDDIHNVVPTVGNLGNIYANLGDYSKAKELFEEVLRIYEKGEDYVTEDLVFATALENFGSMHLKMNKGDKAIPLLDRSLVIVEQTYGANHPKAHGIRGKLGTAYKSLGNWEKAKELLKTNVQSYEEFYGSDHPALATVLGNLANVYASSSFQVGGNSSAISKALELHNKSLAIYEKAYGRNHTAAAGALTNIGRTWLEAGDTAQAKEFFEKSLERYKSVFGSEDGHPDMAIVLQNLGEVYHRGEKNYIMAKDFYERSLSVYERFYGTEHEEVADVCSKLSEVCFDMAEGEIAKTLLQRALVIYERSENPKMARALVNLGVMYLQSSGDDVYARELFERSLQYSTKLFGPNHPAVAIALAGLADATKDDTAEEIRLRKEALRILEKALGPSEEEQMTDYIEDLGIAYLKAQDFDKATEHLERTLEILMDNHEEAARILKRYGFAYIDRGEHSKVKETFERSLLITEKSLGPDHRKVGTIASDLGAACLVLNELSEAKRWLERARDILGSHESPDAPSEEMLGIYENLSQAYIALGDMDNAGACLQHLVRVFSNGETRKDDIRSANCRTNLGYVLIQQGNFTFAKKTLEPALSTFEETGGPAMHPCMALACACLGAAHLELCNITSVERYHRRALSIVKRNQTQIFNPDVVLRMLSYSSFGLLRQFQPVMAKDILEGVLRIYKESQNPEAWDLLPITQLLYVAKSLLGDPSAEDLELALAVEEKLKGSDHIDVAGTLLHLSHVTRDDGKVKNANEYLERALRIGEREFFVEGNQTGRGLGVAYQDLTKADQAKEIMGRFVALEEDGAPDENGCILAVSLQVYGNIYAHLGNRSKARELLERAHTMLEKGFGSDHAAVARALADLQRLE